MWLVNARVSPPLRVVIAGGGVAGLEAALALRDLAGERVITTLLAPEREYVYRAMTVREPFAYSAARRYPLDEIARDIGAGLVQDSFERLDPDGRVVHTTSGGELEYDALVLALGATARPRFEHAVTLDDSRLDEQLHGLIQDVEGGYVSSLAFVAPSPIAWPLPIYELALMTAQRAYEMNVDTAITVATPEEAPLAAFGQEVSDAVSRLLRDQGITTITSAECETPEPGRLTLHPGSQALEFDRIVALPQLVGPSVPGVPTDAANGFIPIDAHCKVRSLDRVWAAGDATDFAVKYGGIAAQQADAAAEAIAALAGAPVEPSAFHPIVHGVVLGGPKPLYLTADIGGAPGSSSQVSESPTWAAPSKVDARYLAPYLESRDRAAAP